MTDIAAESGSPFIAPAGRRPAQPARRLPFAARPAEGWASLGLLILMGLCVGWSIDDARWVLGREGLTDFLPWVTALGILAGFAGAKAGWSNRRTHLVGAVFAALIVPVVVGSSMVDHVSIRDWYVAAAHSAVEAYLDLAWRGKALTQEYGHFLLILGLICWGTGQFAGYTAYGHRRPTNTVLVLGIILVGNMAITIRDQLPYLVIFTLAALLFLIRINAFSERSQWARRRLGDPGTVAGLYLRGGVAFVLIAVLGSLFLTASASSAPLAGAWTGVDQGLIGLGQQLQRFLPGGGPGTRITGVAFGGTASITGRWVTDATPALSITVPGNDTSVYYWRAIAYDHFDLNGWSISDNAAVNHQPGEALQAGADELPATSPFVRTVAFTVKPLAYKGSTVFSPATPASVDRPTRLTLVGDGELWGTLDVTGGNSSSYTVTATVVRTGADDPNAITENRLRSASQAYPPEITGPYLDIPSGAVGPDLQRLLGQIKKTVTTSDPYDIAKAMVTYLRNPSNFTYTTDVTDIACGDIGVAECFARYRRGYCQYYASTMAILLRMEGIPSRMVEGFLPGERSELNNTEIIRYSNSHAWVEAFFPGYGWIAFDPTGGGVAQLAALPVGAAVAPASPTPLASSGLGQDEVRDPIPPRGDISGDATQTSAGGISGQPLILLAVLLLVIVAAAALIAWRRSRGTTIQPDSVYSGVATMASRLGFGPRPTETVFEYTTALGAVIPTVRPDLQLVAAAKVEVAYGRHDLPSERLAALRTAQRRIRVRLLRLLFRRRGRPRG